MHLSTLFSPAQDIILTLRLGLWPTLRALWNKPTIFFHPKKLTQLFFSFVWVPFGDGVDMNASAAKVKLITPYARGVVFEVGAGHGHSARYFDPTLVTKFIALEPNHHMHQTLRTKAAAAGYSESNNNFILIPCGAEDLSTIRSYFDKYKIERVDTLLSILTLCSIPHPEVAISGLIRETLKSPDGVCLFYEHVKSGRKDLVWAQWLWTPIWRWFFDGCELARPTDKLIDGIGGWKETEMWRKEGEAEETLFKHISGRFVRA